MNNVILMMSNRVFLLWAILLFSCNNNKGTANENAQKDTTTREDTMYGYPEDKLIWITDYDSVNHRFFLKKQRTANVNELNAEDLVNDINAAWENIQLKFIRLSNDTLYVSIPESSYLTQQIGTAGAETYISSTTYCLTEIPGIKFVNYEFEEGDHLQPGVYSRDDFKNFR
jgi:hypothetical protein